ncbi:hypothetical protein DFA_01558 [Cavenderia fasciculata]|uniref:Ribosomal protein eL8/eL30/eS12/Gadd45 domain-containing protein n=1 Tax=Cavenderia fasciculata TaxID=261658 RepID=F4PTF0_CACFS|nr:uncharacterized protein DFA_01558 [Cavenderia fasciculata]EGG21672.1 hypothetical protein DFA_01558 [Cavenderia fasciculata]|eukprot:XP_004359522.1 hypothetical protein DFA_01558 [Cavenderia fasciculata]
MNDVIPLSSSSTSSSSTTSTNTNTTSTKNKKKKQLVHGDDQQKVNNTTNPLSFQQYLNNASSQTKKDTNVDNINKKKKKKKKKIKLVNAAPNVGVSHHHPPPSAISIDESIQQKIIQNKKLKNPKNKLFVVRDTPKIKKPTTLKRNILLYKETKEKLIEQQKQDQQEQEINQPVVVVVDQEPTSSIPFPPPPLPTNDNDHGCSAQPNHLIEKLETISLENQNPEQQQEDVNHQTSIVNGEEEDKFLMEFKQDYINQIINQEINEKAREFIIRIKTMQDNYTKNNPKKPKKRFITGLREIERDVDCDKISCVIIAPNIDDVGCEGGLNPMIQSIIRMCRKKQILYTFALSKRIIGRLLHVPIKISAFGVLSHDGAHDLYRQLDLLTQRARTTFRENYNQTVKLHGQEAQKQIQQHQTSTKEINQTVNKEIKSIGQKHKDTLKIHKQAREEKDKIEQEKRDRIKEQKKQKLLQEQQLKLQQKQLEKQKQLDLLQDQLENSHVVTTSTTSTNNNNKKKSSSSQHQSKQQQKQDAMIKKGEVSDQLLYSNTNTGGVSSINNTGMMSDHQKPKKKK